MKGGEKLGILIDLEREVKEKSTELKITRFGSRFVEKSRSKNHIENRSCRERNAK